MMHSAIVVLCLCVTVAAAAVPASQERIVGGTATSIEDYPSMASLLFGLQSTTFGHGCGGAVISNTAVLTAAHCIYNSEASRWRVRVGSSYTNRGGIVHIVSRLLWVPTFAVNTLDNDVGLVRLATVIEFNAYVQPAPIASPYYNVQGNEIVYAAGWGAMSIDGDSPEQLHHVQTWTISQDECQERYGLVGVAVSPNMLCVGVMEVGGRGQCPGDWGSPLFHHGTVVGVASWGNYCMHPDRPGVSALVSRSSNWIQNTVKQLLD